MRYTEFEKAISNLGKEYDVTQNDNSVYALYKNTEIFRVSTKYRFIAKPFEKFNTCPQKLEIWNEASVLAATPLNEREEEKKYNVIIGNNNIDYPYPHIVWGKDDMKGYFLYPIDSNSLRKCSDFEFTESEYQDLLKYIKTLPQGDKQVEIAEIGKTLVEGK